MSTRPDFHAIYTDPLDAELCGGYYDGRRADSPEPGLNRHPAYIHGFMNGREDIGQRPFTKTLAQKKSDWEYIVATCS